MKYFEFVRIILHYIYKSCNAFTIALLFAAFPIKLTQLSKLIYKALDFTSIYLSGDDKGDTILTYLKLQWIN